VQPALPPADAKPAAAKPESEKPSESKPAEAKSAEAKPAEPKPQPAAPAMSADGKFTVQVGSYPDEAQARERVNRLKAAGFDGRAVAAQIPNRGTWYRVQAGRFAGRDEAALYGSQMRSKGVAESALVTVVGKH
jgi:cell division septation protein DedD